MSDNDAYMYKISFRFPPKLVPLVNVGQLARDSGEAVEIQQRAHDVAVMSVRRFDSKEAADAALSSSESTLALLGVMIGYGVGEVRTYAGLARAPAPPQITVWAEPDDKVDVVRALDLLKKVRDIPQAYRTAAKLFDDSFFAADSGTSLVLCTTGLELLSRPLQLASEDVQVAVRRVVAFVDDQKDIEPSIRKRLVQAVEHKKSESIREAVRRKIRAVIPEASRDKVDEIYSIRSKIVHGASDSSSRQLAASHNAQVLLRYLILRGIGFTVATAVLA